MYIVKQMTQKTCLLLLEIWLKYTNNKENKDTKWKRIKFTSLCVPDISIVWPSKTHKSRVRHIYYKHVDFMLWTCSWVSLERSVVTFHDVTMKVLSLVISGREPSWIPWRQSLSWNKTAVLVLIKENKHCLSDTFILVLFCTDLWKNYRHCHRLVVQDILV